jgi:hypothetical protein
MLHENIETKLIHFGFIYNEKKILTRGFPHSFREDETN